MAIRLEIETFMMGECMLLKIVGTLFDGYSIGEKKEATRTAR